MLGRRPPPLGKTSSSFLWLVILYFSTGPIGTYIRIYLTTHQLLLGFQRSVKVRISSAQAGAKHEHAHDNITSHPTGDGGYREAQRGR
jgi:hypothetical protein